MSITELETKAIERLFSNKWIEVPDLQHEESYVYLVFVDKGLKYVGKGCGTRYKHALSGSSSVPELNRDFFAGKNIEVRFLIDSSTDFMATMLERDLIGSLHSKYSLYNRAIPKEFNKLDADQIDLYNECRPVLCEYY